jgi:hypothetical protein
MPRRNFINFVLYAQPTALKDLYKNKLYTHVDNDVTSLQCKITEVIFETTVRYTHYVLNIHLKRCKKLGGLYKIIISDINSKLHNHYYTYDLSKMFLYEKIEHFLMLPHEFIPKLCIRCHNDYIFNRSKIAKLQMLDKL